MVGTSIQRARRAPYGHPASGVNESEKGLWPPEAYVLVREGESNDLHSIFKRDPFLEKIEKRLAWEIRSVLNRVVMGILTETVAFRQRCIYTSQKDTQ